MENMTIKLQTFRKTKEWKALVEEFENKCVRCGYCLPLVMDHIIPKYQLGPDTLSNIQPICKWCNSQKGPENFNWADFRRRFGFIKVDLKLPKKHPHFKAKTN